MEKKLYFAPTLRIRELSTISIVMESPAGWFNSVRDSNEDQLVDSYDDYDDYDDYYDDEW